MKYSLIIFIGLLSLIGCTDASKLQFTTLGSEFNVKCYSGGSLILVTTTTGQQLTSSAGTFIFKENKTGKAIEISANCIFKQK
jgi:hypothetical protein